MSIRTTCEHARAMPTGRSTPAAGAAGPIGSYDRRATLRFGGEPAEAVPTRALMHLSARVARNSSTTCSSRPRW
jgi:hypothetical protein